MNTKSLSMHRGGQFSSLLAKAAIVPMAIGTLAMLAAVGGGASQARASVVNLIQNGGFETGNFTDWITNPAVSLSVTSAAAAGGTYSALYQLTSTNEAHETYGDLKSYAFDLTTGAGSTVPGHTVNISWAWEFSNIAGPTGSQGMLIQVGFYSGPPSSGHLGTGTFLGQYFKFTGLGSSVGYGTGANAHFITTNATYAVPSNAESMFVALGAPNAAGITGTLYFDNVSVTGPSVPEPATLGLVAAGGLGLLLIGRRRKMV